MNFFLIVHTLFPEIIGTQIEIILGHWDKNRKWLHTKIKIDLGQETLTSRIRDACNNVLISDLRGFCEYFVAKFSECLQRKPI
jgi:hypothetical protein